MTRPLIPQSPVSAVYWDAAKSSRLTLQHCGRCARYIFHPRVVCPHCWNEDLSWNEVSGNGCIYTYTVVRRAPHRMFLDLVPYALAVIELDEGPFMTANIVECDVEDVHVGMRVQVTFEELNDGMALPQFRPAW